MNFTEKRRWLISVALCVAMALPALFIGDHAHDTFNEEIECDLCLHSVTAGTPETPSMVAPAAKAPVSATEPTIIPLEQFRLFQYQRGPPLLC